MRLISWNVNGLRACVQKGFLDFFREIDADCFCLQETKLQPGQIQLDLDGYEQHWYSAEKKGYSGTALFTKQQPIRVTNGIGVPELDNEGRVITAEYPGFFLVTCYTPNAQRGLLRLDHRMRWDEAFRSYLTDLDQKKPVIVCGDLNVAHKEIDLKNPGSNRGNAGFSDEEREKFSTLLAAGFTFLAAYVLIDVSDSLALIWLRLSAWMRNPTARRLWRGLTGGPLWLSGRLAATGHWRMPFLPRLQGRTIVMLRWMCWMMWHGILSNRTALCGRTMFFGLVSATSV